MRLIGAVALVCAYLEEIVVLAMLSVQILSQMKIVEFDCTRRNSPAHKHTYTRANHDTHPATNRFSIDSFLRILVSAKLLAQKPHPGRHRLGLVSLYSFAFPRLRLTLTVEKETRQSRRIKSLFGTIME